MTLFSKLSTKSTRTHDGPSVIATNTKAKVSPRLPRGATVLSGIKVAAVVAGRLGSSVPYMQGIVEAANEVIAYAEAMKSNRKECKEIAALAEELVRGLLAETGGVKEDELSERSRLGLAELQRKLETIGKAMRDMGRTTLVRGILLKENHAAQLVDHRRTLQDAVAKFQCVRMDIRVARMEKKQDDIIASLCRLAGSSMDGYPAKEGVGLWPVSFKLAVTRAFRSENIVFFCCSPLLAMLID
ncbi:hypothetical protein V8D89_003987 [Ganoderma adspersum]